MVVYILLTLLLIHAVTLSILVVCIEVIPYVPLVLRGDTISTTTLSGDTM